MRTKQTSERLLALAALTALAACSAASPEPIAAERAAITQDDHGAIHNPFAPSWAPTWDKPFPGAAQQDVAAFFDAGEAHFAFVLPDGRAMHRFHDANGWHDEVLGGNFRGVAAAKARSGSQYWIAATEPNGHTKIRYYNGSSWTSSWLDIQGATVRRPAMASSGFTHVFVVGTDNQLWHHLGSGGDATSWSNPWEPAGALPGGRSIAGAPSAALRQGTVSIDVVVAATDGTLWRYEYDAHGLSGLGWTQIAVPGRFHGEVAVASHQGGAIEIAALGSDHLLRHISWDGVTFGVNGVIAPCSPANQGSLFLNDQVMTMSSSRDGVLDLYVVGTDDLYHNSFALGNASQTGGALVCGTCNLDGDPCCAGANNCHNGLVCTAGRCKNPQCGTLFAPTCESGRACGDGMTPDPTGHCQTCGRLNDRCCALDGNSCTTGRCTHDDSLSVDYCAHCGNDGEISCPPPQKACKSDGFIPDANGICVHCGLTGELACPGTGCLQDHNAPDAQNICRHCGNTGELACPGSGCTDPHNVANPFTHVCEHCGSETQFACSGGVCDNDHLVVVTGGTCMSCGGEGNRSCNGKCWFEPSSVDSANICRRPSSCGGSVGAQCCPDAQTGGRWCGLGMECDGANHCRKKDVDNCGAWDPGTMPACCHNKAPCQTATNVCSFSPSLGRSRCIPPQPASGPPACGSQGPKQINLCARCGTNVDYVLTGLFCNEDDARRRAEEGYPGCDIHDAGQNSVCPGI